MNLSLLDPFQNDFPEVIEEYLDHRAAKCIAFNRRGTLLAAGCADGVCVIWDFDTRGVAKELPLPPLLLPPPHETTSPATADSPSSTPSAVPPPPPSLITSVAWSKCGRLLLAAYTAAGPSAHAHAHSPAQPHAPPSPHRVVLWDVAAGSPVTSVALPKPALHVRLHPSPSPSLALVCPMGAPPALLHLPSGKLRPLPTSPKADGAGGGAGKGGRGGGGEVGAGSLPWPAVFDKSGSLALVGAPSGHILVASVPDAALLAAIPGVPSPAGGSSGSTGWAAACIRQLALSRDGRFLLSNCTDRVLRVFSLATAALNGAEGSGAGGETRGAKQNWERGESGAGESEHSERGGRRAGGSKAGGGWPSADEVVARGKQRAVVAVTCVKEYQDAVNRVHWRSACFSGDGEFVVGGVAARGEHKIHIWNRAFGQLVRILEGPKEALADLVWHPTRKVMASLSGGGSIYLWAQDYRESWSAFAPDFRELEENEEYVEREDEFDAWPDPGLGPPARHSAGEEGGGWEEVDIERVERVAAYSDSDDSSDALLFLPTHPLPTPPPPTAAAAPAANAAAEDAEEEQGQGGRARNREGGSDGEESGSEGEEGEGQGSGGAGADSDSGLCQEGCTFRMKNACAKAASDPTPLPWLTNSTSMLLHSHSTASLPCMCCSQHAIHTAAAAAAAASFTAATATGANALGTAAAAAAAAAAATVSGCVVPCCCRRGHMTRQTGRFQQALLPVPLGGMACHGTPNSTGRV
ncbi:unnamed protein product [Closterium sp. NIES-53]